MTKPTKIRAKAVDGIVDFRMLMRHEMESGLEKTTRPEKLFQHGLSKNFVFS